MNKRKTAGELSLKAANDNTKYDPLEIGHALVEDNSIENGLYECIQRHNPIFAEDLYCVGYIIASDPLIKGVMRRNFFAMLHLPSPRPEQAVFLYNKRLDKIIKRLWVLPAAYSPNQDNPKIPESDRPWTMERLYLTRNVPKKYLTMKAWSIAFYDGVFWEFIRKQHDITMLSEKEFLESNREKFIQAGCKELVPSLTDPFDFSKISVYKVVNPENSVIDKNGFNDFGKA